MNPLPRSTTKVALALALVGILAALALGVLVRLEDPMSSTVIPAEDPYTHMALVREHLWDGNVDPLYDSGTLYPPGMHAFVAAAWVYTGLDLYEIVRLGPVLLGAIGIIGMAVLLWRMEGPVAGFVGGLAYALAPEVIFRTTMLAPTALDLALLPFLFYAFLELVKGRLGWVGVAGPLCLYLVFTHPWLLLVLALAGAAFVFLAFVLPWSAARAAPLSPRGLAAALAVVGASIALADSTAGSFRGTLNVPAGFPLGPMLYLMAAVALLPLIVLLVSPEALDRLAPSRQRRSYPLLLRGTLSVLLLVGLVAMTVPAVQNGMPDQVNLPRMFGWPILALAALAFVALPFIASPTSHLGAAVALATYPFVIYNPLGSEFWPHRTAVFLGIGLVLLAGIAAGAAVRGTARLVQSRPMSQLVARNRVAPVFALSLPVLLVATTLGGGVFAGTPLGYDGWYRLYPECDMDALRDIGERVQEEPEAIVVAGDWQAKLVIASLTTDAERIWYKPEFFMDADLREEEVFHANREGRPMYVVVDRHLRAENPQADTGFLHESPWVEAENWCSGSGGFSHPSTYLYTLEEVRS